MKVPALKGEALFHGATDVRSSSVHGRTGRHVRGTQGTNAVGAGLVLALSWAPTRGAPTAPLFVTPDSDPGSRLWIPAFAGMTAKTPATVSLLGFSTSDGQMDIILGNYSSYGSWYELSHERSGERVCLRVSTQRDPPGNQYGTKGHILISSHQLQLYQFQKRQECGEDVETGKVFLEK